jgi:membrane fusion protein (multidrug efflux system)
MKYKTPSGCYFLLSILLLTFVSCENRPPAREKAQEAIIAEVEVLLLKPQSWTETINSYGVVEAAEEITITVDFSDRVTKVHFKEGNRVKAGQLLVEFDREKQSLRLTQSGTTLKESQAALDNSLKTFKRQQALFERKNISRSRFEEAQLEFQRAKARYEESIAAVQLVERDLADRKITSPAAGLVEKRSVNPGETVTAGTSIAVIQTVATVRIVTFVTEKEINHLRLGSEAIVTTSGVQGRKYIARIESLGAKADPTTGTFNVKLTIPNPEGLLRPGMTTRVKLQGKQYQDAIWIPDNAFVDRNRRRVVYKVVDGMATEVEPVIAFFNEDRIHVLSGLQAGDQLIINGLSNIKNGSKVKVIQADTEQTPET